MNQTLEEIRDQQRETWNQFSPGWKKWDQFTMAFLRPMGDAIIAALDLADGRQVLDLATGTGEPGLTMAAQFPASRVTGVDLSEGMLGIAEARARSRGVDNYRTQAADVCALPFGDASFDAVSCRLGMMFFPDLQIAAREIARVLKPGGRFATVVWDAPEKNPWITTITAPLHHRGLLQKPPPGAPGIFRCAPAGLVAGIMRDAGLVEMKEKELPGRVTFESPEEYWTMTLDVGAPVAVALNKADTAMRDEIKAEVFSKLGPAKGPFSLDYSARLIAGNKPA